MPKKSLFGGETVSKPAPTLDFLSTKKSGLFQDTSKSAEHQAESKISPKSSEDSVDATSSQAPAQEVKSNPFLSKQSQQNNPFLSGPNSEAGSKNKLTYGGVPARSETKPAEAPKETVKTLFPAQA